VNFQTIFSRKAVYVSVLFKAEAALMFNSILIAQYRSCIFLENSRTWKVLENQFGSGQSWKLKLKVVESLEKISLKIAHFIIG